MTIAARPTRLLLRLWHALRQSDLATALGELNASNAAATSPSIPYTLPTTGYTVEVTSQVPGLPDKGLQRITLTPFEAAQDVIGLSGYAQGVIGVQASCFLSYHLLTVAEGSGWTGEQILQCAGLDLAEVVRRVLTAPALIQTVGAEQIARIVRSSSAHRLELVGEEGRPTAVRAAAVVFYEQQTDF